MFENIWTVIKNFCANHSQHVTIETIFLLLAIISGAIAFICGIMFIIKLNKSNRKMKKDIAKSKKISDKKILSLLKKKKNVTY